MNTEHYKAASEKTDEAERLLIPPFKRARVESHTDYITRRKAEAEAEGCYLLTLQIEVDKDGSGAGKIYCPDMRSEFPTANVVKDAGRLVKDYLDLVQAEA
jgi:hypothetical protein